MCKENLILHHAKNMICLSDKKRNNFVITDRTPLYSKKLWNPIMRIITTYKDARTYLKKTKSMTLG